MSVMPGNDKERIPLLFVLPTLGTGGSERIVFNLCLYLKKDYFPIVAAFRDGELRSEMEKNDIQVHVLKRKSGVDLSLVVRLAKVIKENSVRIANSHHFGALFYLYWATRYARIPLVHTEHSKWEMERLSRFWDWWFNFYKRLVNDAHLNIETKEQMMKRLGDNENDWREAEEVTAL